MKTIEAVACHKCGTLHTLSSTDLTFFNGKITKASSSRIILDGEYPFCIVCLIQFLREELQGTVFRG